MNDNLASPADKSPANLRESLTSLASRLQGGEMEMSPDCQEKIARYLEILSDLNQKVNLVGNCHPYILVERHTADGLILAHQIGKILASRPNPNRARYLDIGTGAGLPGMIVAISCPQVAVTLMDATAKKCTFLQSVIAELGLKHAEVVNGRAEEMARESQFRERYKFVSARAVGTLKLTIELAVPFLMPGGIFLAQKTRSRIDQEAAESRELLANIGAELGQVEAVEGFAELSETLIVPVKKLHPTPQKYPRDWKIIAASK